MKKKRPTNHSAALKKTHTQIYIPSHINTHRRVRQVGGTSKAWFMLYSINYIHHLKNLPKNIHQQYDKAKNFFNYVKNSTKKSKIDPKLTPNSM